MYRETERKNIRLQGYDYSSDGYYFVTICVKYGECVFGDVKNEIMGLSDIGCVIVKFWQEISNHFDNVKLDKWIVMPNHVHGIVVIQNHGRDEAMPHPYVGQYERMSQISPKPKSLPTIIGSFKSIATKTIRKYHNINFQWQYRFYDHIIRNNKSLNKIRNYIINNPEKWARDRNNPANLWM